MRYHFTRGYFEFEPPEEYVVDGLSRNVRGRQAELLRILVEQRPQTVPDEVLRTKLIGSAESGYVRVVAARLRDALGSDELIVRVRGLGFRWNGVDGEAPVDFNPQGVPAGHLRVSREPVISVALLGTALAAALFCGSILHFAARSSPVRAVLTFAVSLLCTTLVAAVRITETGHRRVGQAIANGLTYLRPGIALAAAAALGLGDVSRGTLFFLIGQLSDVADGFVSRKFGAGNNHGRDWDAVADSFLTGAFAIGLASMALRSPQKWWLIVGLLAMGSIFAATRRQLHTVLDKVLSGAWRLILFLLVVSLLPGQQARQAIFAGLLLLAVAAPYEFHVLRDEVRARMRPLFRWSGEERFSLRRSPH